MQKLYNLLLAGLLFYLPVSAIAQEYPEDWGQISEEILTQTVYPDYPDEEAVVLFERGSMIVVRTSNGRIVKVSHHIRIKILSEEGLKRANVALPFYRKDRLESVLEIEAQTINLENGAPLIQSISKKDIFRENLSEDWGQVKFSLPNVRVGSVIEYKYVFTSENVFSLPVWYFQTNIPTLRSELRFFSPTDMAYTFYYSGHKGLELERVDKTHWKMEHVPAIRDEPFMTTLADYQQQIHFQLKEHAIGGRSVTKILNDWEDFSKKMIAEDRLGKRLKKEKELGLYANSMKQDGETDEQTLDRIYQAVRDHMTYSGRRRIFAEEDLGKAWDNKTGSSAEINLILTYMLREVGIEAHPLMISTRGHGALTDLYPIFEQFDQLLCHVSIGDKEWTLNAVNPLRPASMPAMEDLNGKGWLLDPDNPRWAEVRDHASHGHFVLVQASLDTAGMLKGTYVDQARGYTALEYRQAILRSEESDFIQAYMSDFLVTGELTSFDIEKLEQPESELKVKIEWESADFCESIGDQIYLKPMLDWTNMENPFLSPKRLFLIDFGYPIMQGYSLKMELPEGYEVAEIPEPASVRFPDRSATFNYEVNVIGNTLVVESLYVIRARTFAPEDYAAFKQLYDHMIAKHAEQLVIRRKK